MCPASESAAGSCRGAPYFAKAAASSRTAHRACLLEPCGCTRGWRRREASVAPRAVKSHPSVLQQPDRLPVPFGESTTLQTAMRPVIQVSGVRKSYGATVAVHEVSFEVNQGEIFGLIGPNGAGKTTTMECIEGLRTPDRGGISVLGLDPFKDV